LDIHDYSAVEDEQEGGGTGSKPPAFQG